MLNKNQGKYFLVSGISSFIYALNAPSLAYEDTKCQLLTVTDLLIPNLHVKKRLSEKITTNSNLGNGKM